ncbi:MAG: HEAT repeat domain-containing protein [Planctomycetota bacterium]|jgi:HEAT repeat protein
MRKCHREKLAIVLIFIAACASLAGEKVAEPAGALEELQAALEKTKTDIERFVLIDAVAFLRTPAAADYLAGIAGGEIVIKKILEKSGRKAWDELRAYALRALASNNLSGAENAVKAALSDSAAVVRAAAVVSWSMFSDNINIDRVTAFFNDESPLPQIEAAKLLGKLTDKRCKKVLLSQLDNRHAEVRSAVLNSLIPWRAEVDPVMLRAPLLNDGYTGVRVAAVELVARGADEEAIGLLADAFLLDKPLDSTKEPDFPNLNPAVVNDAVLEALAQLPAEVADKVLVESKLPLEAKLEPFRRGFVIRAVGKRKIKSAVEALAAILSEDTAENRELAAAALGEIGEPGAEAPLIEYFADGGFDSKLAALEGLAKLKALSRVGEVIRISQTYRWEVKVLALNVLASHPTAEGIERLAKALGEKPWQMQIAAARALGKAQKKECIGPLVKALENATGRFATEVLNALWNYTQDVKSESASEWRAWWKKAKKDYAVPDERFATRPERVAPKAYSIPFLFKERLDSVKVVVILDSSFAMWRKTNDFSAVPMKTATKEISSCVKKLPGTADFNIIEMREKPVSLWPHLASADLKGKRDAQQFLKKIKESNYANLEASVARALDDPDADTVVIITASRKPSSVGAFNLNSHDSRLQTHFRVRYYLECLRRQNRFRMASIWVFSFGAKDIFLETLAVENSGRFIPIPVP